jgi:hypothetical protein
VLRSLCCWDVHLLETCGLCGDLMNMVIVVMFVMLVVVITDVLLLSTPLVMNMGSNNLLEVGCCMYLIYHLHCIS